MLAKRFYVIQPVIRADSDLSSYDMIEWPEEQKCMQLTIRCVGRCQHRCNSLEDIIKEEPSKLMEEVEGVKNLL